MTGQSLLPVKRGGLPRVTRNLGVMSLLTRIIFHFPSHLQDPVCTCCAATRGPLIAITQLRTAQHCSKNFMLELWHHHTPSRAWMPATCHDLNLDSQSMLKGVAKYDVATRHTACNDGALHAAGPECGYRSVSVPTPTLTTNTRANSNVPDAAGQVNTVINQFLRPTGDLNHLVLKQVHKVKLYGKTAVLQLNCTYQPVSVPVVLHSHRDPPVPTALSAVSKQSSTGCTAYGSCCSLLKGRAVPMAPVNTGYSCCSCSLLPLHTDANACTIMQQ